VARRWRDPNAFRAEPAVAPAARPTRRQSVALLAILVLVAGVIAAVSYLMRPERARAFDLFSGSIFLADSVAPVSVDLATGSPSVRLIDAAAQVGLTRQQTTKLPNKLAVVPLDPGGGTLLLNRTTGEFNMVYATGFVIKTNGGVPLPAMKHTTAAVALPAHDPAAPDLTYIEQIGRDRTHVYLVSQATVLRAQTTPKQVKPRASIVIKRPGSSSQSASTSAGGDLWMLTRRGAQRVITQLSLPKNSYADGAMLDKARHGTVPAPAAIGSAAADPEGPPSAVGVASSRNIKVFLPDGSTSTVKYPKPVRGANRVVAVSNQTGRLAFLLHASSGWSLVSVGMDGTDLRGPTPISDLPAGADLAPPAASGDALYTVDRRSDLGSLWRISFDGTATRLHGAPNYPLTQKNGTTIEPNSPGWSDTYVIARGYRVFYDSPSHREALAVFTDGTHPPLVIQKSAAVGVNAIADASALSRSRNRNQRPPVAPRAGKSPPPPPPSSPPPPTTAGQPPIDNNIDCLNTAEKPHIPQILPGWQAGTSSVTLSWQYPLINNTDCIPRTYQIFATPISGPDPRGTVTWKPVEDHMSATLGGLYPASSYKFTVTAYLGSLGTASNAVTISTTPQGPAAPINV
jgi:hypothetical protein